MVKVSGYYVGFPASESLSRQARDYIRIAQVASHGKDIESLKKTLRLLAFETIDVYLIELFRVLELGAVRKKLLNVADKAIKTTAGGVITQVAKKLDTGQQQQIAGHIDSCLVAVSRQSLNDVDLVACPVPGSLYDRLRLNHRDINEHNVVAARRDVLASQKILFDTVVGYMVERLITIISLGPVNQRIVRTAIDKCVSLTHTTFERMVDTMNHEELRNTADYMDQLLLKVD